MKIYRDFEGDLWARTDDGRVWLGSRLSGPYAATGYAWEGPVPRTLEDVEIIYGPLQELAEAEAVVHVAAVTDLAARIAGPGQQVPSNLEAFLDLEYSDDD